MSTVSRSHFFRLFVLVICLTALVSLPVAAQDTTMADSIRVTVVAGAMQDVMTQIVDTYQAANPGVTVTLELEPEGGAFQALIAAGNQPDLIITSFGPQLGALAAQDAAVALEDLPGAQDLLARLESRALQNLLRSHLLRPHRGGCHADDLQQAVVRRSRT